MKKLTTEECMRCASQARRAWITGHRRARFKKFRVKTGGDIVINPPAEFSFTTNYEDTVTCLRKLKHAALKDKHYQGRRVSIEFEPIKQMSIGAALVLAAEIHRWKRYRKARLTPKNLAVSIRYALNRMSKARPYLSDGRLELDNNICERSIRPIALGRKNYLLMGAVGGGKAAAIAYTLIETAKMNNVAPKAWLTWVLECLTDHKITGISELMPWEYTTSMPQMNEAGHSV